MMQMAGGWLGWPQDEFWRSAPRYFFAAIDGYLESRGVKRQADIDPEEVRAELARLGPSLGKSSADLVRMRELQRARRSALTSKPRV